MMASQDSDGSQEGIAPQHAIAPASFAELRRNDTGVEMQPPDSLSRTPREIIKNAASSLLVQRAVSGPAASAHAAHHHSHSTIPEVIPATARAAIGRTNSGIGRTNSVLAAEASMELVRRLKASLADMDSRAESMLLSCQSIIDSCGDAIRAWFKGLSGAALQRAIKQAFDKFDEDGSGLLDQEEFERAMHVLGLRLKRAEYKILFDEYDVDGSGQIDLEEFTHMVKKYLDLPCDDEECVPCSVSEPDNQPRTVYQRHWAGDEPSWSAAASVLQRFWRSLDVREKGDPFSHDQYVRRQVASQSQQDQSYLAKWESSASAAELLQGHVRAALVRAAGNPFSHDKFVHKLEALASRHLYRGHWNDDEASWDQAATVIESLVRSATVRANDSHPFSHNRYVQRLQAEIDGHDMPASSRGSSRLFSEDFEGMMHEGRNPEGRFSPASPRGYSSVTPDGHFRNEGQFSRALSAPHEENSSLLTVHEAQQAKSTRDDLRTKSNRNRVDSKNEKIRADWDLAEQKARLMRAQQGLPNQNLNHDNDQFLFRDGARVFLDENGNEIGQNFSNRNTWTDVALDQQPDQTIKNSRFAIVDPWPGQLPPLARGTYMVREGLGVLEQELYSRKQLDNQAHMVQRVGRISRARSVGGHRGRSECESPPTHGITEPGQSIAGLERVPSVGAKRSPTQLQPIDGAPAMPALPGFRQVYGQISMERGVKFVDKHLLGLNDERASTHCGARTKSEQILLNSVRYEQALLRAQADVTGPRNSLPVLEFRRAPSVPESLGHAPAASLGPGTLGAGPNTKPVKSGEGIIGGKRPNHEEPVPVNWQVVPSKSRPGDWSYVHIPTGLKQSRRPSGEPSAAAVAAFQEATAQKMSRKSKTS